MSNTLKGNAMLGYNWPKELRTVCKYSSQKQVYRVTVEIDTPFAIIIAMTNLMTTNQASQLLPSNFLTAHKEIKWHKVQLQKVPIFIIVGCGFKFTRNLTELTLKSYTIKDDY